MKNIYRMMLGSAAVILMLVHDAGAPSAQRPFIDRVEAVIVKGQELPTALLGGPIASYRLFADTGSGLAVIPFQIDERDPSGRLLVTLGSKPDKLDGRLDKRDELIFMARDVGASCPAGPVEGCEKTALIKLTDKQTGASGQALLAQCSSPPPLSEKDYIRMTPQPHTAVTERYRLGWRERMVFAHDYITVTEGPDLLDRLRVRATISKWGVDYTFHEDQFTYSLRGYNDGPVRVSWKADNYWSLGPLGKLDVPQEIYFYPETLLMKNTMDVSMNPALIGLDLYIEIGHDMNIDPARNYTLCVNALPECRPLQYGNITEEELRELTERKMEWGGVCGPEGGVFVRLVADSRLNVRIKGLFNFDPNFSDPPEYVKGSLPRMSFYLVDWKNVKAEKYDLSFYFSFLDPCTMPEFERFNRSVDNPLAVSVGK